MKFSEAHAPGVDLYVCGFPGPRWADRPADEMKASPRADTEETQDHPPFDGGNDGGNGL